MIAWDCSTEPPTMIVYCDQCGQECTVNYIDIGDKKHHICSGCMRMNNFYNVTINQNESED